MKIGFNITPLNSGHRLRGIGYYSSNLLEYLKKEKNLEIVEFTNLSDIKNVELVHYPWFDFYFHTLPIKKKFRSVITIHDTIPIIFPSQFPVGVKGKINFILQKLALKNINAIITDSEISKKDIIKCLGIDSHKIFPILLAAEKNFQPISDTKLIQAKMKFKLPDAYLLYVGDANWNKNLHFLIKGFARLIKKKQLMDLKLILVGEVFLKNVDNIDHPELKGLKTVNNLIKQLDLMDKVIRPGKLQKEDLVAFYNLATVYVQPSLYEGFGLPVLEALSCGTPVISSNAGSLPEVGGDAAVYFNPDNLSQFVNVAEEILLSKSIQKKLSYLALKQASKFSWKKTAEQTKEVYHRVISNE